MSIKVQTVSRCNLISHNINYIYNVYLAAKLKGTGLHNSVLKETLKKTFLDDAAAWLFAVTELFDVLQNDFIAKSISTYNSDHIINFVHTCLRFMHTKLNCQPLFVS